MAEQNNNAPGAAARGRIDELDALRGLAAFVVIWCHFRFAFQDVIPNTPLSQLVRPLFAGHESVTLFFILSGFVLALPIWRGKQPAYPSYLVRRTFRIYVPFLAALALAAVGSWLFGQSQVPLTDWFHHTWSEPVTQRLLLAQLLIPKDGQLNTAFWSLRYEMEMSILFPVICWLLLRLRWWGGLVLIAALEASLRIITHLQHGYEAEWMTALRWSEFFMMGAILSMKQQAIAAMFARIGPRTRVLLFLLSVGLYYSYFLTWINGNIPNVAPHDTLIGIGAVGLMLFAMYSPRVSRVLNHSLPRYLGQISYSMYLVHGTILFALLHLLYGKLPIVVIAAIYLPLTIAASHLFNKFVEMPATRLGKTLSMGFARTPTTPVAEPARTAGG